MHAHGEQPIISEDPTLPIVSPDAPGQCSSPRLPQLRQSQGTCKTYLQGFKSPSFGFGSTKTNSLPGRTLL
jgi:hypothetical protein